MIYLTVFACVAIVANEILLLSVLKAARDERCDLENRLMAMSEPNALYAHMATKDPEPGEVSYMDERAEAKVGNGNVDLVGDDVDG